MTTTQTNTFQSFIHLARWHTQTGWLLLFIPILWGLSIGNHMDVGTLSHIIKYGIAFLILSILTRSIWSIFNDIQLRNTQNNSIAMGNISPQQASIFGIVLTVIALLILFTVFNFLTIILAIFGILLTILYFFIIRSTAYSQIFLGIGLNYGIILGYTAITHHFDPRIFLLYIAGIFWTLAYDSIYSLQIFSSIQKNKANALSLKIYHAPKTFVSLFYAAMIVCFMLTLFSWDMLVSGYIFMIFIALFVFYMIIKWDPQNMESSFLSFRFNRELGFWIALALLIA